MKQAWVLFCAFALWGCGKEKVELIWEQQESHTAHTLSSVFFLDENRGFAVGGDTWNAGVALETSDGGRTWIVDSLANKQLFALDFNEEGEGVAAGIDGYVFSRKVEDTGWSFFRYPVWEFYRGLSHGNSATLLVGGEAYKSGTIVRLDGDFQLDTALEFVEELNDVHFVTEQTAIAAGYGIVLRSEDGGRNWTPLPVSGDHFRAIHFPSERVGYIAGYAGTILKTEDSGLTWTVLRNGGGGIWVRNVPFRAVFFSDEERGYLAGDGGTVWKTTNGGLDWSVVEGLPEIDYHGLYLVGSEGWLVGENGAIIHFQD